MKNEEKKHVDAVFELYDAIRGVIPSGTSSRTVADALCLILAGIITDYEEGPDRLGVRSYIDKVIDRSIILVDAAGQQQQQ